MFKDDVKWSQIQEREFRVFAADDREKRLRFPPMKPNQRAFLHALASDFGLDSESMDPEPHRHIVIFKTPKFVSAPMKTLAQCVKLNAHVGVPVILKKSANGTGDPYNGLLLTNPKFGITTDELQAALSRDFESVPAGITFDISFLPNEEIVISAKAQPDLHSDRTTENALIALKPVIFKTVLTNKFAGAVALCRVDRSLNVLRKEDSSHGGGWSQVAAKGSNVTRPTQQQAVGGRNAFTVLGNLAAKKAKAKQEREEEEKLRLEREREAENAPESWEDVDIDIDVDAEAEADSPKDQTPGFDTESTALEDHASA